MSIWVSKNPEFYAVFRYEEIIQKKMYRKKLDPNKHFFWGHRQFFLEKQFSGIIFCRFFFWIIPSDWNHHKFLDFYHPYRPIPEKKVSFLEGTFRFFFTQTYEIRIT